MTLQETHAYDDIINLPHHQSRKHPHMSRHQRAAQFMPFAALTGYNQVIEQTAKNAETAIAQAEAQGPRRYRFRRLTIAPVGGSLRFVSPRDARTGRQRLTLAVLAGQQTLCERGEGDDADVELAAGAHDLVLDVTVVQVVLRLNHGDRVQVVAVDDAPGFLEASRTPLFGDAVVQHLALGDQVSHTASASRRGSVRPRRPNRRLRSRRR